MIKIQNNYTKIELHDVWIGNGDVYYFARTAIGVIREFIKLHEEQAIDEEWGDDWKNRLKSVECNDEQLDNAASALCEKYPEKYLGFEKLKKQIKGKVFAVYFE